MYNNCLYCTDKNTCGACVYGYVQSASVGYQCVSCASTTAQCTSSSSQQCTAMGFTSVGSTCVPCAASQTQNCSATCINNGYYYNGTVNSSYTGCAATSGVRVAGAASGPLTYTTCNQFGVFSQSLGSGVSCQLCAQSGNNPGVYNCSSLSQALSCNAGYQISSNQCVACQSSSNSACAATCISAGFYTTVSSTATSNCTSCLSSLNACQGTCSLFGFFTQVTSGINSCVACPVGAQTCSSSTVATLCIAGYYLQASGVCITCPSGQLSCLAYLAYPTSCNSGYFINSTSTQCQTCSSVTTQACPSSCLTNGFFTLTSSSGSSACTACANTNTLTCSSATVATSCNLQYFLATSGSTTTCTICSGAGGPSTNGNTCAANGYYLATTTSTIFTACTTTWGTGTSICTASGALQCQTGYYLSITGSGLSCVACGITNGLSCSNGNIPSSTSCAPGYFYLSANTSCVACNTGTNYATTCTSATVASACVSGYYPNTSGQCTSCSVTVSNACGTGCTSNGYFVLNSVCTACGQFALSCTSATVATSCQTGYYSLSAGSGTSLTQTCTKCSDANAYSCTTTGVVSACKNGYYLGYGSAFQTCVACPTGVATCTYTINVQACAVGYFSTNTACTACTNYGSGGTTLALTCGTSASNDLTCVQGAYLVTSTSLGSVTGTCTSCATSPSGGGCGTGCTSSGYFATSSTGICIQCQSTNPTFYSTCSTYVSGCSVALGYYQTSSTSYWTFTCSQCSTTYVAACTAANGIWYQSGTTAQTACPTNSLTCTGSSNNLATFTCATNYFAYGNVGASPAIAPTCIACPSTTTTLNSYYFNSAVGATCTSKALVGTLYGVPDIICPQGTFVQYSGTTTPTLAQMQAVTCAACPSNSFYCVSVTGVLNSLVCNNGYAPVINGASSRCASLSSSATDSCVSTSAACATGCTLSGLFYTSGTTCVACITTGAAGCSGTITAYTNTQLAAFYTGFRFFLSGATTYTACPYNGICVQTSTDYYIKNLVCDPGYFAYGALDSATAANVFAACYQCPSTAISCTSAATTTAGTLQATTIATSKAGYGAPTVVCPAGSTFAFTYKAAVWTTSAAASDYQSRCVSVSSAANDACVSASSACNLGCVTVSGQGLFASISGKCLVCQNGVTGATNKQCYTDVFTGGTTNLGNPVIATLRVYQSSATAGDAITNCPAYSTCTGSGSTYALATLTCDSGYFAYGNMGASPTITPTCIPCPTLSSGQLYNGNTIPASGGLFSSFILSGANQVYWASTCASASISGTLYGVPAVICPTGYYFSYLGAASPSLSQMQAATCAACPTNAVSCSQTNGVVSAVVCQSGYQSFNQGSTYVCYNCASTGASNCVLYPNSLTAGCATGYYLSTLYTCITCGGVANGVASCGVSLAGSINALSCLTGYYVGAYTAGSSPVMTCTLCGTGAVSCGSNCIPGSSSCSGTIAVNSITCATGYYQTASSTYTCTSCSSQNALACSSGSVATTCINLYYQATAGTCQACSGVATTSGTACPAGCMTNGYYQATSNGNNIGCTACGNNVQTCTVNSAGTVIITSCQSEYYLAASGNPSSIQGVCTAATTASISNLYQNTVNPVTSVTLVSPGTFSIGCSSGYGLQWSQSTLQTTCVTCTASTTLSCANGCNGFYNITNTAGTITGCGTCSGSNVLTCSSSNQAVALTCAQGYYVNGNATCVACTANNFYSTVGAGSVTTTTTNNYNCIIGPQSIICSAGFTNINNVCTQCSSTSTTCSGTCTSNGYVSGTNSCSACADQNALTCSSVSVALTCKTGYYVNQQNSCSICQSSSSNILTCPISVTPSVCNVGYVLQSGVCVTCPNTFATCESSSSGSVCLPGFYLASTTARTCTACPAGSMLCTGPITVQACMSGYYPTTSGTNGFDVTCNLCNATSSTAQFASCASLSYVYSCNLGNYVNLQNTACVACATNGLVCANGNLTQCAANYYVNSTLNNGLGGCVSCGQGAQYCTNSSQATQCQTGFAFAINGTCWSCSVISGCQSCSISSSTQQVVCNNCTGTATLSSGQCTCPTGQYQSGSGCSSCGTNCAACSNANTCSSCNSGFTASSSTNSCYQQCSSTQYQSGLSCQSCSKNCSTNCTSGSTCNPSNCASGYSYQKSTNTCQPNNSILLSILIIITMVLLI